MAYKVLLSTEDVKKAVELLNKNQTSLEQLAEQYGTSKKTITRRISNAGFEYNKKTSMYYIWEQDKHTKCNSSVGVEKDMENENKAPRRPGRPASEEDTIKRTYSIPVDIDIALKVKAAKERKSVAKLLVEILRNNIEPKYFE